MKRSSFLSLLLCLFATASTLARTPAPEVPASPQEVRRLASELMNHNYQDDAPGAAVLIARGDQILFRSAVGEADVRTHTPLRPDSVFRIGSITKQFAAAGLLRLVEAGKVRLDDPLSVYLPDYPGGDRITVRELLNHTSGVMNYTSLPGYMDGPVQRDLTTAQMVEVCSSQPPDFAPGAAWSYSNSGYVLVGAIIEVASGQPWYTYLERTLFKPLGMKHTGWGGDPRFTSRQVHGYTWDGNAVRPANVLSMTQPHAAGGLVSNVDDLLTWNRALHEGRVLSCSSYAKMIIPVGKAADPGIRYGFGLFDDTWRGEEVLRHGGGIFGFVSSLAYVQGPDITVAVLENDDAPNAAESADTLARKFAAIALGEPYPEMREVHLDPEALTSAEGVYRFDDGVARVLRVVDGRLTARREGGERAALTPIEADDFLYDDGFTRLTLERDSDRNVTAIRFYPGGEGKGERGIRSDEPLPADTGTIQLSAASLERLVGTYTNRGLTLRVYMDGNALKGQIEGQPPVGLAATSETVFNVEETGAVLEFSVVDGVAREATIRQNERALTLERVEPDAE